MTYPAWRDMLALSERVAPEYFEPGQPVTGTPYADEIRKAMQKLSIAGVFCNQGVPQIMVFEQEQYDRDEVMKVHAALWNQGLASILVVPAEDEVRVFSLARDPGTGDRTQFEDRCLIEAVNATADALALRNYVYGAESGRLWLEKETYFDPKSRIDRVLLNNLEVAHDLLSEEGLSADEAQAILIQTMFVAYLEDREITTATFFQEATNGTYKGLNALLYSGDVAALEALFAALQRDFNGDLFVAPCSFDDSQHPHCLTADALRILGRFREGKEEMAGANGQMRFWGYDFAFIPVELISAVYDRFLGYDPQSRSDTGAYYTPMFLVDTTISTVWDTLSSKTKTHGVFLDPACGSGIFLVRSFQRLCEHRRNEGQKAKPSWEDLVKTLQRVRGFDLNGSAVRVAVFSLYIALLEEVSPPNIWTLAKKGRLLPSLWDHTLICKDFFDADQGEHAADVIVGNPPWTSRRKIPGSGLSWCKARKLPTPSGEVAWAFVWKAQQHVSKDGCVGFLLPAMGFLHNHAAKGVAARIQLFETVAMRVVINLSDLRRQLFDGAIYPTALMVYGNKAANDSYHFDYWTPKADLNLKIKRFVTLSSIDKSSLSLADVKRNPLVFKQRLWMRGAEAKLFGHLDRLPKLSAFVSEFGSVQRKKGDPSVGWVVGQGYQPYHGSSEASGPQSFKESSSVGRIPDLPVKAVSALVLTTDHLEPWNSSRVRRSGFERAFSGPRILFRRGVDAATGRLRAAYSDVPLSFQDILQAIVAPEDETTRAKFIAGYLNSRLAAWFAFHGTSSFGASRPEVQQAELLRLPMPDPDDLPDPEEANSTQLAVANLVDREQERAGDFLRPQNDIEFALCEIDAHIYSYFGLSEEEITIVEDTVNYVLPAVQPSSGSFPELWKQSDSRERKTYAQQLISSLSFWFPEEMRVSAEIISSNEDFGILKLQLTDAKNAIPFREDRDETFTDCLQSLSQKLGTSVARNFQTVPDIRIFSDRSLYLIKPLQKRFWLKSSALTDADVIASDLQTLLQTSSVQSAVS